IDELVQEFILLRQVVAQVMASEGLAEDGALGFLADVIEPAIALAVRSYVDSRDFAARKAEAEHVGFITHELRNPLGTAFVAASQRKQAAAAAGGRALELLDRSLVRLRELVEGVLLSERLESGAVAPEPREVPLGELIQEAVAGARAQAHAR